MTEARLAGPISVTGQRVLFGILVVLQAAVLGAFVVLAVRHGSVLVAAGPALVFAGWVALLAGPWRPPEMDRERSPDYGAVSWEGVRGFGLPAGVMWRWEEVDRVVLSHAEVVPKLGRYIHPLPMFVLIRKDGRSLCLAREAFAAGGWISPQRFLEERCSKEKVTRDDAAFPRLVVGGAYVPMWPVVFSAVVPALVLVEALEQPLMLLWGLVVPLLSGVMAELVRCRWTAIAVVGQLVAGMWGAARVSPKAAEWMQQGSVIEGLLLVVGFGWLLRWVRRGEW